MRQGKCSLCGKIAWVNLMIVNIKGRRHEGEACADCFDRHGPLQGHATLGRPSPRDEGGSWDNVIRASEEDQ